MTVTPCTEPFAPAYAEELALGGPAPRHWYSLAVTSAEGFVTLALSYDVAQIYADGQLVADDFYCGKPWRIPASLLYKKQCYLVATPASEHIYMEPKEKMIL